MRVAALGLAWGLTLSLARAEPGAEQNTTGRPVGTAARAQRAVTIADTERHELPSAIIGDTFKLHVYFPRGYNETTDSLPVVYLLDAEYSFGAVAYTVRRLVKDSLIPPVLVVGVAYEVPYDEYYRHRERDFAPTPAYPDVYPVAGRAEAFAQFLRQELMPYVNGTFRVDPNDRTIVGLSLSGLFEAYLLFNEPELFNRYVIVSPSLWWDDALIFDHEVAYHRATDSLPARVYVAAGEHDGPSILRDLSHQERPL